MHKEIFKFNGFKVVSTAEENPDQEGEAVNPNEFLIKSLPQSKNITFTVDDFMELIQIVNEHLDYSREDASTTSFRVGITDRSKQVGKSTLLHKELLRPKKVYTILAVRACRNSITVGKTLDQKAMKKVVMNLTTLESPWNCPHGRPTLRFLKKLKKDEDPQQ